MSASSTGETGTAGRMPTGREILNEAFMELLDWKEPIEKYPEVCLVTQLCMYKGGSLNFVPESATDSLKSKCLHFVLDQKSDRDRKMKLSPK